ncbi:hypothetical protein FB45DRAFT_1110256 [Roridomyces roridus]|uniref:Uncharacterized protein n=1 Tax=Roridomyces roridus TaxID=1738132 RepID=A0AAD7B9U2_9AGAR|nr:hypothetical protein FB45DRAFT_1110256 [Roridomyces roridus]
MPLTGVPLSRAGSKWSSWGMSVADMTLLQQLELYPFNTTLRTGVYLHEVENELAKIVASMFWTLGHAPPLSAYTSLPQPFDVPFLAGQAIVTQLVIQDRLNLDIISIVECLLASLALLGLSFRFSSLRRAKRDGRATTIHGLDVLQTIWLYRYHSQLSAGLEQVQVPTDMNLRRAGMLQVQLIDGTAPVREASDSWEFGPGKISEDAHTLSEPTYPSDKPLKEQERLASRWTSDWVLRLLSAILHSALVAIHVFLAVLCRMKLEHRITFPLAQQSFVAWLISTIATGFITIYTVGLVFLTQTLSIKRSLCKTQTLTVTHDTVAAWRGVGSALAASVFHQAPSLSAVVPVLMYLGGVLILHISSPTLLTVQVFNSTVPVSVKTQGIPKFAFASNNSSSIETSLRSYAEGTLPFLPFVNSSSPTPGLEGGMLYSILNAPESGPGNGTVDAVRINMTCGYLTDQVVNSTWLTISILGSEYCLTYTDIGIISPMDPNTRSGFPNSVLFYSTVPILDSAGYPGPLVAIPARTGPSGSTVDIQVFRCSLGLVNGSVTVDSQSRILSNDQAIRKDSSAWLPFRDIGNMTASKGPYDALANDWESWYTAIPFSNIPHSFDEPADTSMTIADMFFIERFHLNATGSAVTLHQFEDALAEFIASIYWTLGHIPPLPGYAAANLDAKGLPAIGITLLQGNSVFVADTFEARLDANMSFIILGTVVSGVLFLLSLQYSVFRNPTQDGEIITGMGPLHIIWLYRNHRELEAELEQVVYPTTSNLRKAGMVRTRLAGRSVEHFIEDT